MLTDDRGRFVHPRLVMIDLSLQFNLPTRHHVRCFDGGQGLLGRVHLSTWPHQRRPADIFAQSFCRPNSELCRPERLDTVSHRDDHI